MKQLLTLFVIFTTLNTFAETVYYKVKIFMTDGQIKEGCAELPANEFLSYNLKFKEYPNDNDSINIKNNDITSITYYTEQGNEYSFERLPLRFINKSFGKVYDKIYKEKRWYLVVFTDPLITFYCYSSTYNINSLGTMISRSSGTIASWGEVTLHLRRPGETAAAEISTITAMNIIGEQSHFRKIAAIYFQDTPILVQKIKAKEFRHDELMRVVNAYIRIKEKMTVPNQPSE